MRFVLHRAVGLVGTLLVLITATFLMLRLAPGDPARRIAGLEATPDEVEHLRETLGLNRPLFEQWLSYAGSALHLDFGKSYLTSEPVTVVIGTRLPLTLALAGAALLLVMCLSLPIGMLAAMLTRDNRRPRLEVAFTAITSIAGGMPSYLAATLFAAVFAVFLKWLPVAGAQEPTAVILPAAALGLRPVAVLSRIVRVETLNVLSQDYIRTARSKQLPPLLMYPRHVLPNALTGALTLGGLLFASLIGGAVIVENVFAWPGVGTALVRAVLLRDYPVVQGVTLVLGVVVVVVNTLVDLILVMVDPRSVLRSR